MEKKRGKTNIGILVHLEIAILIVELFAISYIINEATPKQVGESIETRGIFEIIISSIGKFIFGNLGFVSAADSAAWTCLYTKNNESCQEFSPRECNDKCNGACIPALRKDVSECQVGTCVDPVEGKCQPGSPWKLCSDQGGIWKSDPNGNIPECKRGCCLISGQASFVTQKECTRAAQILGSSKTEFKSEVQSELECVILSRSQEEGACVFDRDFEKTCKFTTLKECIGLSGNKDNFHSGVLCSNKDLNTTCVAGYLKGTVSCVDGKDELYWFDSCGNRENIYDANGVRSWNNGLVLGKNESCQLGSSSNPFQNQGTCGNCNYVLGSICGKKTSSQKLSSDKFDYVCRDLNCIDENGIARKHGDSWCVYQGSIGVDDARNRATDTPGSRHFRETCINGQIQVDPCADYRNEICVESDTKLTNGQTITSAACRINRWQECLSYNSKDSKQEDCTKNPDCFVKEVNLADKFKFNLCTPRYPPGFLLSNEGSAESAKQICNFGSQKCTVVYVKQLSGWKCKANCNCVKSSAAEKMNDLCISLGDCGAKVNYEGDLTVNFKSSKAGLSSSYLSSLKIYSKPVPGKYAEPGNYSFAGPLGFPEADEEQQGSGGLGGLFSGGSLLGMGGMALRYLATEYGLQGYNAVAMGSTNFGFFEGKGAEEAAKAFAGKGGIVSPQYSSFSNALQAIGAVLAVAAIVYQIYGYVKEGDYLMAAITVVTAVAATYFLGGFASFSAFMNVIPVVGLIVFVVTLIMQFVFGIGKTKKVVVEFTCMPWQAPDGGTKCAECGKDGLPCSLYSCKALGQSCSFLNEGTGNETCVNVNPNDVTAPTIKPLQGVLSEGFSYNEISDEGMKIKSSESDGCLKAYQPLVFGIETDEAAQCRFNINNHTDRFSEMANDFGGSNLYIVNHTSAFLMPSLESLGLPGYDPNRQADYNLYVRCKDANGNANTREFDINFCVKPGDDKTPPIVVGREPNYTWVKYDAEKVNSSIFTNEPSECKWDLTDKDYSAMAWNLSCANGLQDIETNGWRCRGEFPVAQNGSNIFVRCKDQPWLIESPDGVSPAKIMVEEGPSDSEAANAGEISGNSDDEVSTIKYVDADKNRKRNTMNEGYKLIFTRSSSELKIDSITPKDGDEIISGTELTTVNLEVHTSGGVDGKAFCSYEIGGNLIGFKDTWGTTHKQVFESFLEGKYTLPIKCKDLAGNSAEGSTSFSVHRDTDAPIVTRAFNNGGTLNIVTNENSQCVYDIGTKKKSTCNFDWENATLMNGDNKVHSTSFDGKSSYLVSCKDSFGNRASACSMIVSGGVLTNE